VWDLGADRFLDAIPTPGSGSSSVGTPSARGATGAAIGRIERAFATGEENGDRGLMVDVRGGRAAHLACVVVTLEHALSGLLPVRVCVDLAAWFVAAAGAFGSFAGGAAAPGCVDELAAAADAEEGHPSLVAHRGSIMRLAPPTDLRAAVGEPVRPNPPSGSRK
jgi:hypothetical protein